MFKLISNERQHVFAVVFLCVMFLLLQSSYAFDTKIPAQINYLEGDSRQLKKITKTSIKPLRPAVSIIIDDIGDRFKDGLRAVNLPAPYTYSFLPNTPFAKRLADQASHMNKEVMLHMPMQATNGKKLGPNGLTSDMTREVFDNTLQAAMNSIPHVKGVNNHMGSLLSADKEFMGWVMSFVARQKNELYFIDSRTTAKSVIVQAATQKNIRVLSRDTFIDYDVSHASIKKQINYLIKLAKKNGIAIGIAHPYPETLDILESAWPLFYEAGVDLIPVSELINLKRKRELSEWQLSSSH